MTETYEDFIKRIGGVPIIPQRPTYIYDEETYPNFFSIAFVDLYSDTRVVFEISDRRNDLLLLLQFLTWCHQNKARFIGFNNINFDGPILQWIMDAGPSATYQGIYEKAMSIINSNDRWGHLVKPWEYYIEQVDLFKIHHFDNMARSTSLKALQVNMRSESVEDLPFPVGTELTDEQKDIVISYNIHDIDETKKFAIISMKAIEFRDKLTAKYNRDFTNHNDTKIGKDYFIMCLGDDRCFHRVDGKRVPNQTVRHVIDLSEVVFPYIAFQHPEFQRILGWFKSQRITETKGVFTDVSCEVDGFQYDFGTGGIHGSVNNRVVRSDSDYVIRDIDVASYYPNLAIANRLYPAHLGEQFCDVYLDTYNQRKEHAKGTTENAMLKLALNGVYGDSNNPYSPFYDPQYTMSITINGQLLLCMLADWLRAVPGLEMIQINTDGMTVRLPREHIDHLEHITSYWENHTRLQLEHVDYAMMAIRDVNNYLAVYEDGKVKRKGAYDWKDKQWHQDQSALVVPYAAEQAIVNGIDVRATVYCHGDMFDFMLRAKAPRGSILRIGDEQCQRISRYYVAKDGAPLTKVMPPPKKFTVGNFKKANGTSDADYFKWHHQNGNVWNEDIHTKNKSRYEERTIGLQKGYMVAECNHIRDFNWDNLNREYYVSEAMKLVDPLLAGGQ